MLSVGKVFHVGQLRGPWVPAPAKSSNTMSPGGGLTVKKVEPGSGKGFIIPFPLSNELSSSPFRNSSMRLRQRSSNWGDSNANTSASSSAKGRPKTRTVNNSILSNNNNNNSKQKGGKQVIVRKPTPIRSKTKHGFRRTGGTSYNYKLQSKDSLVDVTACLQAKRVEVMKIWEKHLRNNDPGLLSLIENANRLALEAAEEVELLRRTIQDFQSQEEGLTDEDCAMLNDLRANVLIKVRQFEEVDNQLRETLTQKPGQRTVINSESEIPGEGNQTGMDPSEIGEEVEVVESHPTPISSSGHDLKELIVIKDKSATFSATSETDFDNQEEEEKPEKVDGKVLTEKLTEAAVTGLSQNLFRLQQLYEKSLIMPQMEKIGGLGLPRSRSSDAIGFMVKTKRSEEQQQQRSVRFVASTLKNSQTDSETLDTSIVQQRQPPPPSSMNDTSNNELNQQKISQLQRKLMGTEQEIEDLKSEIERIESDANFRVRMLQNTVQDKFETLAAIPEYLQIVELKINDIAQVTGRLQQEVNEKEKLILSERELSSKLKQENQELRDKLRQFEGTKELLNFKNYELEKCNMQLREEINDMAKKYTEMSLILKETEKHKLHRDKDPEPGPSQNVQEVRNLKQQCLELEEKLSQSKQIIKSVRKSKEKMAIGLNEKLEELMDALIEAQHHKRLLGDQIRYLKKSYNELFPSNRDPLNAYLFKTSPKSSRRHRSRKKPVNEPKVEAKVTWQTGTCKTSNHKESVIVEDLAQLMKLNNNNNANHFNNDNNYDNLKGSDNVEGETT